MISLLRKIFKRSSFDLLLLILFFGNSYLSAQPEKYAAYTDTLYLQQLNTRGEKIFYQFPDSANFIWQRALTYNRKLILSKKKTDYKINQYILRNRAELLYNLGTCYYNKGDINSAMKNYLEAKAIYEQVNEIIGLSSVYNNLGLIQQKFLNNYNKALKYYLKADSLIKNPDQSAFKSVYLTNLGRINYLLGNTEKADNYFKRALEMARETKDSLIITQSLVPYAAFKIECGKIKDSEKILAESINIHRKINGSKRSLAQSLSLLGSIYFKKSILITAEKLGKESLQLGFELNYPSNIASSSKLLYQIYEQKGSWEKAHEMLILYDQMTDSLTSLEKKNEAFRQEINFEYQRKRHSDSLAFNLKKQQEELIIEKQKLQIQADRNLRNLSIIAACILLAAGYIFNTRQIYRNRLIQKKLKIENLDTEQKLLRAQMNPHFIFNSLNAIQGLILNNEVEKAKKFLLNFSILMRSVLEHTTQSFVSVKDEIYLLRSFLSMEELRFKDKIAWCITEAPDFENKKLMIPPLIIQPFVEAALIRLIQKTDMPGLVEIEFIKSNNHLVCKISDNGQVKNHSEGNKYEDPSQRNSLSIALAIERLKKINSLSDQGGSVEYLNGNELGTTTDHLTKVIIRIPIHER